jgi:hypothetical protein
MANPACPPPTTTVSILIIPCCAGRRHAWVGGLFAARLPAVRNATRLVPLTAPLIRPQGVATASSLKTTHGP